LTLFWPADHSANVAVITVQSALPVVACAVVALGFGSAVAAPTFVLAPIRSSSRPSPSHA